MAQSRPPIPEAIKIQIIHDQANTCCICQNPYAGGTIHHIVPWAESQDNSYENLAFLCPNCHDKVHKEKGLTQNYPPDRVRELKQLWIQQVKQRNILPQETHLPSFKELPRGLTGTIPRLNPLDLVGRESALVKLRVGLETEKRMLVVNGIGGVGKTSLAMAYTFQYWEEYKHVVWLTADKPLEQVVTKEAQLLENLGIRLEGLKPKILLKQVFQVLDKVPKPRLLVLDNATQALENYQDVLPQAPDWHVLVTSREEIKGNYTPHYLDLLQEDDAISMFAFCWLGNDWQKKLNKNQREEVKKLVRTVEYHTLTVRTLGLAAKEAGITLTVLLDAMSQGRQIGNRTNNQKEKIKNVFESLKRLFEVQGMTKAEVWLLQVFACLPPDYHPFQTLSYLLKGPSHLLNYDVGALTTSLVNKGWLQSSVQDAYKMHRMMQQSIVENSTRLHANLSHVQNALVDLLTFNEDYDNPVSFRNWLTYGDSFISIFIKSQENLTHLLEKSGVIHQELGNYKLAEEYYKEGFNQLEKFHGNDLDGLAILVSRIGGLYVIQSKPTKAIDLYKRSLNDLRFKNLNPISKAKLYGNLGYAYLKNQQFDLAVKQYEKALSIEIDNRRQNHPQFSIRQSDLANAYISLGNIQVAKNLLIEAEENALRVFQLGHPSLGDIQMNLAKSYRDLGQYDISESMYLKALDIFIECFEQAHPKITRCQEQLSSLYSDLGRYEQAISLLELALESNLKLFEETHFDIATNKSNLAILYNKNGEYEKARRLLEEALAPEVTMVGPIDLTIATRKGNLGNIYRNLGDNQKAKEMLEEALRISEEILPMDHPKIALRRSNLANVYRDLGEYDRAINLYQLALQSDVKNYGPIHQKVANRKYNLASTFMKTGNFSEARDLLESAKTIERESLGKDHPTLSYTLNKLALTYWYLKEEVLAISTNTEALQIAIAGLSEKHPQIMQIRKSMAYIVKNTPPKI
ncbi:MAG TPA: hypothetical protein DCE41_02445 [Cytophagales bacterium]|nr:hypothetical protein [Cytophagales bacterium]HAA19769.1 hypothetical protein [Cytophagales bacterium]HAP65042.1 hypothetical protein [Cytophagales bacterium]